MSHPYKISDVKPVTFEKFHVSDDGELVIFEIHDKAGNLGHIGVQWLQLSNLVQLIGRAAEKASEARRATGKEDWFDGSLPVDAQLVSAFQVSESPTKKLKLLSLHSPVGFRCDFAIPTDIQDERGRPFHRAIAEELLSEESSTPQPPH